MKQILAATLAPSSPLPPSHDLGTLVADITTLWHLAVDQGPAVKARAEQVFRDNPGARNDLDSSRKVLLALRDLLGLEVGPGSAHPPTGSTLPQADDPTTITGPTLEGSGRDDIPESEEDRGGKDRSFDTPEDHLESAAPARGSHPTLWADGLLGTGLISALATTLAAGDAVQLSATELLATVVPQRLGGEPAATCRSLQARGTPRQLDEEFPGAAESYREVRRTAREVADELLEATKSAAASARTAATRAAEAVSKNTDDARAAKQATLTVTPNVEGAILTIKGDKATHTPAPGQAQKLDPGRYAVRVEAAEYDPHEESVLLVAKETKTLVVTLKARPLTLF